MVFIFQPGTGVPPISNGVMQHKDTTFRAGSMGYMSLLECHSDSQMQAIVSVA